MKLKETIENHPIIIYFGVFLVGFLLGSGAYKAIIEIAKLETVPKYEIEKLKSEINQKEEKIKKLKLSTQEQERDKFTLDWPLHPISRNEEYVGGTIRGFTTEELSRSKIEIT